MVGLVHRATLKRIMPNPLWIAMRRSATVAQRILIWQAVLRELEGARARDRSVLQRSFRSGIIAAFRELDVWQDPVLIADATIHVPRIGEFDVRAHCDDLYHILPSREAKVLAAINALLQTGSTFIDAGANIGFFTVFAAGVVGPSGRVVAVEMMPDTAERLRRHLRLNGLKNVTVQQYAVSDRSGIDISANVPEAKFGRASIVSEPTGEAFRSVTVQTRTIDELLVQVPGHIDLIKMDLESAETLALRGAREVLSRTDAVIFEQLPGETGAAALLSDRGFHLRKLDGSNVLATRAE
jgi:FkbM family methyltransferase